jgi:hypothetical protein
MPEHPTGAVRRHFTYANVMSTLAVILVVAGGTALAASLPTDSVNSKTVKNNSLKGKDIKDSSLKSADIGDDSLTGADVLESSLQIPWQPASGPAGGDLSGSFPNPQLRTGSVASAEVLDKSLHAIDISDAAIVNRSIAIGDLSAHSCQDFLIPVTGLGNILHAHVVLTPVYSTTTTGVTYAAQATNTNGQFAITACNVTNGTISEVTTAFNMLIIT